MNAISSFSSEFPTEPVITEEGRFFRVSVLRHGRVESYLCETAAQARHFAALLALPPTDVRPRASTTSPAPRKPASPAPRLSLVPTRTVSWKGPR